MVKALILLRLLGTINLMLNRRAFFASIAAVLVAPTLRALTPAKYRPPEIIYGKQWVTGGVLIYCNSFGKNSSEWLDMAMIPMCDHTVLEVKDVLVDGRKWDLPLPNRVSACWSNGRSIVKVRLKYDANLFPNGIPQFSFRMTEKPISMGTVTFPPYAVVPRKTIRWSHSA